MTGKKSLLSVVCKQLHSHAPGKQQTSTPKKWSGAHLFVCVHSMDYVLACNVLVHSAICAASAPSTFRKRHLPYHAGLRSHHEFVENSCSRRGLLPNIVICRILPRTEIQQGDTCKVRRFQCDNGINWMPKSSAAVCVQQPWVSQSS